MAAELDIAQMTSSIGIPMGIYLPRYKAGAQDSRVLFEGLGAVINIGQKAVFKLCNAPAS